MKESRIGPVYDEGVEQFLKIALDRSRPNENGKFFLSMHKLFEREIENTR